MIKECLEVGEKGFERNCIFSIHPFISNFNNFFDSFF